jgi:hypothetical protein
LPDALARTGGEDNSENHQYNLAHG